MESQAAPSPGTEPGSSKEAPLTYLSLGMWCSRRHAQLSLLILPERFVFLADRSNLSDVGPSKPDRLLKQLGAKSPFSSTFYSGGCVFAFEVSLANICGLDYSNPLCSEGRVAMEVHHVRKREFRTMDSARAYYLSPSPSKGCQQQGPSRDDDGCCRSCSTPVSKPASGAAEGGGPAAVKLAIPAAGPSAAAAAAATIAAATGEVSEQPAAMAIAQGSPSSPKRRGRRRTAKHSLLERLEAAPCLDSAHSLGGPSDTRSAGGGSSRSSLQFSGSFDEPREVNPAAAEAEATPTAAIVPPVGKVAAALAKAAAAAAAVAAAELAPSRQPGSSAPTALLAGRSGANAGAGSGPSPGVRVPSSPYAAAASSGWEGGDRSPAVDGYLHVGSAPSLSICLPDSPLAPDSPHSAIPSTAATPGGAAGGGAGVAAGVHSSGALLRHARSTGDLLSAAAALSAVAGEASLRRQLSHASYIWPSPYIWTSVSEVYEYRTVIFQFTHPELPELLRPVVEGNERLLKMYESGLPSWAVFMPAYGFYYRPWLRTATWLLYYAFSIFSLACGFYDLYKNLPGLQLLLSRLMSSVWLPPSWFSVLGWLAEHAQFRLSILLTYLFGTSQMFAHCSKFLQGLRVAVQPAVDAFGPPLAAAAGTVRLCGLQAWQLLASLWLGVGSMLFAALAPFMQLFVDMWASVAAAFGPLLLVLYSGIVLPVAWALAAWRQLQAAGGVLWVGLVEAGRGIGAGVTTVRASVSAGKAVRSAAPDVAYQVSWLYLIPGETLELVRNSALKVMRALQTVAKFALEMCSNAWRHRLTLQLRFFRAWRRGRQRLSVWLALPGRALLAAVAPIMHMVQMLLWLAVSDADRGTVKEDEVGGPSAQPSAQEQGMGTGAGEEMQAGEEGQALVQLQQEALQGAGAASVQLSSPRLRQKCGGRGAGAAEGGGLVDAGVCCECSLRAASPQKEHVKAD